MKCEICGKTDVWARVEGKPYCSTHYRVAREAHKKRTHINLIKEIDAAAKRYPDILKYVSKELIDNAKKFHKELQEPKVSKRKKKKSQTSNDSLDITSLKKALKDRDAEISDIRSTLSELTSYIKSNKKN